MTGFPLVTQMLEHRDPGEPVNGQTRVSDWMIVAPPLAIPEGFRDCAISRERMNTMRSAVLLEVRRLGPEASGVVAARPHATGVRIEGQNIANGDGADLLLDAGGVAVGRMRKRLTTAARSARRSSTCTCGSSALLRVVVLFPDQLVDRDLAGKAADAR
jgi:hypothetical protein